MIDEGHIVGNHTYRHYTMDEVDTATAKEEITFLHNFIKKNFNYEMTLFRFPKGEFSKAHLRLPRIWVIKAYFGALLMPIGIPKISLTKKPL